MQMIIARGYLTIAEIYDGEAAVMYRIVASVGSITRSLDGTLSQEKVRCYVYKITGNTARELTAEKTLRYQRIGQDSKPMNVAHPLGVTADIPVTAKTERIEFSLYDSTTSFTEKTLLDREEIAVIPDVDDLGDKIAGYDYLKAALADRTTIDGGLLLTSLIRLGKDNADPMSQKTWSGHNGVYANGRTIASWWGGDMADLFDERDKRISPAPDNAAAALVRMDGSAYFSKGNIGFRTDGSGWLGNDTSGIKFDSHGNMTFGSGVTFNVSNVSGLKDTLESLGNFNISLSNLLIPCDKDGNELEGGWAEATQDDGAGGIKAKSLKSTVDFWSAGGITCLGPGTGGGTGSGGSDYSMLQKWSGYVDGVTNGYVLSAELGYGLYTAQNAQAGALNSLTGRVGVLEGKNYLDALNLTTTGGGNAVTAVALSADKKAITVTKGATFLTQHQSLSDYFKRGGTGTMTPEYVDLTTYTNDAPDYKNYQPGTYNIQRSSHSDLVVNFALNAGSTSALQLYTNYDDRASLKYRKTIDAKRVSGPWRTILTELNTNISGGVITINGTSITPLTAHQSLTHLLRVDGTNGTAAGVSALINKLATGTSTPTDADYYVCQWAGGGTTTTTYHRRPMSAMWSWIKGHADSVYQPKGSYAAASHTHSEYVTALGTSGNYLTWTRNGVANNLTVPYATNSDQVDGLHASDFIRNMHSTSADLNTLTTGGMYRLDASNANKPSGGAYGQMLVVRAQYDTMAQMLFSYSTNGRVYVRSGNGVEDGAWSDAPVWQTLALLSDVYTKAEIDTKLTDGSVTKVGNSTVGSATKGIYLNAGTPSAMTYSLGATLNAGAAGKLAYYSGANAVDDYTSTVGNSVRPVYINAGVPTASTSTVGGTAKPMWLNAGTMTAFSASIGAKNLPVWLDGGTVKQVDSVGESYLSWGGRSISGGISPVDCAASNLHSANRLAFAEHTGITIEYSRNGGSSWTDYGASASQKRGLVSGIGQAFYVGGASKGVTTACRLRLTLNATKMGVYTAARKLLLNISTNGAVSSKVQVDVSHKGSETSFATFGTYDISGWSGWNSIPLGFAFGGGDTQTSNIAVMRLTFFFLKLSDNEARSNALQLLDVVVIGDTYWACPSTMAKTGHLYLYDADKNATFPANVTAPSFTGALSGNAASATKLATARTINGTSFDGTAGITTAQWGTARNIGIVNSDGTGTAVVTSVNGGAGVNLKLPATIKASLTGNASTATTLQTARALWGQSFDGSANVTGSLSTVADITMSGRISSSKVSGTHIAGNQGQAIINSTAPGGGYNMLARMRSTGGVFCHGTYQTGYRLYYTDKATVEAGTNTVTRQATLLNEAGDSEFPGSVRVKKLSIDGHIIEWDATNESFKLSGNLYATGGITCLGPGTGGGTGGSGSTVAFAQTLTSGRKIGTLTIDDVAKDLFAPATYAWSEITSKPTTLAGAGLADGINTVYITGGGNAVTAAGIDGHTLTLAKSSTFLTAHQSISHLLRVDGSNGTSAGVSALINKLIADTTPPSDNDYYVGQVANGGSTNTEYRRKSMSLLWAWAKGKADAVYAPKSHTHSEYVTSLGTSGNYLTWTRNGVANNLTVPYATNSDQVDGLHASDFIRNMKSTPADLNTLTTGGMYMLQGSNANIPPGCGFGNLLVVHSTYDTMAQMCFPYSTNGRVYVRSGNGVANGAWSNAPVWQTLALLSDVYTKSEADVRYSLSGHTHSELTGSVTTLAKSTQNNEVTIQMNGDGLLTSGLGSAAAIRRPIDFRWYDSHWQIGNVRGSSTNSLGFGITYGNNSIKLLVGTDVTRCFGTMRADKLSVGGPSNYIEWDPGHNAFIFHGNIRIKGTLTQNVS